MLEAVRRLVDEVVLPSVERWDRDDVLPEEVLGASPSSVFPVLWCRRATADVNCR